MSAAISFQPVPVMIGKEAADGRLAFARGQLVAVLVRLSGAHYDQFEGCWYLEAGFGGCAEEHPSPFASLDDAEDWIDRRS